MSDVAAAADAPASAPQSVPIDSGAARIPNPAGSEIASQDEVSTGQPPSGKDRRDLDAIIKSAHEKVTADAKAKDTAPKPATAAKPEPAKPEPAAKPAAQKGPDGKFVSAKPQEAAAAAQQAPKPATGQHAEPPSRFSADAKAEWATAPESVRAEVHRMHREFEAGYTKHRAAAEAYETVRDFDEFTKAHGGNLRQVITNYATLEQALVQGDEATKNNALAKVFQRAGVNPREWAAKLLGQPVEQRDAAHHSELTSLRTELANLRNIVGGVADTMREQKQSATVEQVTAFAKDHPRFDELSSVDIEHSIQTILKSNLVPQNLAPQARLQKAYELADRLNPASGNPAPLSREQPPPANDAGTKSIAGSPANGSDPSLPARKKNGKHPTIDEAINRARARVS